MNPLFPHLCDVKRAVAVGTNGRATKQTYATGRPCIFIPMPSRAEIENKFSVGSAYDAYFPNATEDVKAGDQLVWNSETYNVRAVRPYLVPLVGHTHCLVTREGM